MRDILKLKTFKTLGQNFLLDEKIAERVVSYATLNSKDVVLEVGPGLGVLTEKIAKHAKRVIAVEKDKRLVEYLKSRDIPNIKIIHADALKIKLPKFNKIISNLPYQISSPITFKFLDYEFELAVLMYQQEFAQRLVAEPYSKDYSRLTVNVYYRAKCKILELVPRTAFYPRPKVDSAIISLIPHKKPPFELVNEELFFKLVGLCFSHRRKKIRSVLINNWEKFTESRAGLEKLASKLKFKDSRIEELAPAQIAELANQLARVYKLIS